MYTQQNLNLPNENELRIRAAHLKEIHDSGVTYEKLWGVIINRWNDKPSGSRPENWNEFDLVGWVDFYRKQGIEINSEQLELVFKYLSSHYSGPQIFMYQSNGTFKANHATQVSEGDFFLEKVSLLTLES